MEGIESQDLSECELVHGMVIECQVLSIQQSSPSKHVISVYNPNLETQNNVFLRVPRNMLPIKVEAITDPIARLRPNKHHAYSLPSEAFCEKKYGQLRMKDDKCDVLINLQIPGLSFAFMQVTVSGVNIRAKGRNFKGVRNEVVFSYD